MAWLSLYLSSSSTIAHHHFAGLLGGVKGVGKGIVGTVYYPLKGVALAAEDIGLSAVNAGVLLKTKGGEQCAGAKRGIG